MGQGTPEQNIPSDALAFQRELPFFPHLRLLWLCFQTLRKKGFNGCDSPEPDGDDSIDQSPLMEDKYRKGSEDLDILFKRYGVSSCPWLEILHYMFFSVLFLFCSTSPRPVPAPPRVPHT